MKRVLLNNRGQFKGLDVVTAMLELPAPNQGVTYGEMKKRIRILDAVERDKANGYVDLEDADYEHLLRIMNEFQFACAKKELRLILDDIATAKDPKKTTQLHTIDGAKEAAS